MTVLPGGEPLRRSTPVNVYSRAVAWKRPCAGISSRAGTGQAAAAEAILPALLPIHGGCGPRLHASEVRGRWNLPRRNATECLARIGFLCRQDNGTERSDGASDRSVLRLCFSTLRKIPSLYGAVSDRY